MRHWRESVRYFGFWRALRELAAAGWRISLELLPSRRKARFGDLDYDWEHQVDTTRSNVSFRAQLLAELAGRPYFASDPWLFEQIMQALPIRFQAFTFIDLGSGKGRALLMASRYKFKRIIGVEFMPEWHRAAQENIAKFTAVNPSAPAMESVCMDARDYDFPAEPLVVYLFNPFPEPVFVAVLERLRLSALTTVRPLLLAYRYTEFESQLEKWDWLKKIAGTEQWAVYGNRRDRA
ncbi:MAG TPA: class I SAM-dependent methyltransferase [Candidatus Angelobacter sp.]|nr:class I SAM-dependent methyltransferase [Candidatus Angelobacter sp.]